MSYLTCDGFRLDCELGCSSEDVVVLFCSCPNGTGSCDGLCFCQAPFIAVVVAAGLVLLCLVAAVLACCCGCCGACGRRRSSTTVVVQKDPYAESRALLAPTPQTAQPVDGAAAYGGGRSYSGTLPYQAVSPSVAYGFNTQPYGKNPASPNGAQTASSKAFVSAWPSTDDTDNAVD